MVFLEKLGVVRRVFRTISMNGIVVNNVLYLELIVDRLKELTYPEETGAVSSSFENGRRKSKMEEQSPSINIDEEVHFVGERAVPFQSERVTPFKEGAYPLRKQSLGHQKRYLKPIVGRQIQRLLQRLQ